MSRTTPVHSGYTILNGSGTGSNGGRIDVWVEYSLGTQSVTGNYTPVTAYFYAALNPSYSSTTSNARGLNSSFFVDGAAGSGVSDGAYDFTASSKVNLLGSFSGNISHNADGTKQVQFAGSFTTLSSYISGGSVSAAVTLPTIAQNFDPPVVSGTAEDCNPDTLAVTGDPSVFVRGKSNALCTITATAANGATITEKTVGGTVVSGNSHTITGIETGSVVFTATDSRGSTGRYTHALTMLPYVSLTCNASVKRVTPTGSEAILTVSGQCWRGSFGVVGNGLTVTCRVNGQTLTVYPEIVKGNSYSTTVTIPDLDYTQTYRLEVTAQDTLSAVTKVLTVQKGQPVFDWGENDFQFHVPVYFPGNTGVLHDYDMDALVPGAYCIVSDHPVDTGVGKVYTGALVDIPYLGSLSCRLQVIFPLGSPELYIRHKWYGTWTGFMKHG